MRRALICAALCLWGSPAWATAYTSQRTGNWNVPSGTSSSPWYDGGTQTGYNAVPGSGDTATITTGVTVTIPDGYTATIGTTGGTTGTVALTLSSTSAALVIGGGTSGTLALQGDMVINSYSSPFTMNAGSSLQFNPASGQRIKVSFAVNNPGCKGSINGTSSARCSVYTSPTALAAGGLKGYIAPGGGSAVGINTISYCDFTALDSGGTSGTDGCVYISLNGSGSLNATVANCTFASCSRLTVQGTNYGTNVVSITHCNFGYSYAGTSSPMTTIGGYAVYVNLNLGNTAQHSFTNNYVGGGAQMNAPNVTYDGSILAAGSVSAVAVPVGYPWTSMNGCLLVGGSGVGSPFIRAEGTIQNCYLTSVGGGYVHYISLPTTVSTSILNCIFDGSAASNTPSGEGIISNIGQGATVTYTIKGNITVPHIQGTSAYGVVLWNYTTNGNYLQNVTLEHNTCFQGDKETITGPESAPGKAGDIASFRANIGWNYQLGGPTGGGGGQFMLNEYNESGSTGLVTDLGSPSSMDYNCSYNLRMTYPSATWYTNQGNGYASAWSATPGAHDQVNVNPQFVDPGRNMGKWWRSLGNTTGGSDAADATSALGQLALLNTSAYSPQYTVAALLGYVRAGYAPTNPALRAASYPGDASAADAAGNPWPGGAPGIGAMAYQSTAAGGAALLPAARVEPPRPRAPVVIRVRPIDRIRRRAG